MVGANHPEHILPMGGRVGEWAGAATTKRTGTDYDDRMIRAKLAQAFGRLIRSAGDKGHFVLLSSAVPSRLLTAFPPGTPIRRVTLDEAVRSIKTGLSPATNLRQDVQA